MSENIKWAGWKTEASIGSGSFGEVYRISRDDEFGVCEEAALKIISVPRDKQTVENLRSEGFDDDSITERYRSYVADIVREYKLMIGLRNCPNIVHCDDYSYEKNRDGVGWQVCIKMELLMPLMKVLDLVSEEKQIIRLGMDVCNALVACSRRQILHRDIKPQNIFLAPDGNFKLGDFGISRMLEGCADITAGIGTLNYMAPEVFAGEAYGHSADIYSLGLVLYWLLNGRRHPFLPLSPEGYTPAMEEEARVRRFRGEALPPPRYGGKALKEIVLKACAFVPGERFSSAEEMLNALSQLQQEGIGEEQELPAEETLRQSTEKEEDLTAVPGPRTGKKRRSLRGIYAAGLLLCFLAAVLWLYGSERTERANGISGSAEESVAEQMLSGSVERSMLADRKSDFALMSTLADGPGFVVSGKGTLWSLDRQNNTVYEENRILHVKNVAYVKDDLYYLTESGDVYSIAGTRDSAFFSPEARARREIRKMEQWTGISRIYGFGDGFSQLVVLEENGRLRIGENAFDLGEITDVQGCGGSLLIRCADGRIYGYGKNNFDSFVDSWKPYFHEPEALSLDTAAANVTMFRESGTSNFYFAVLSRSGMLSVTRADGTHVTDFPGKASDMLGTECALYVLDEQGALHGLGTFLSNVGITETGSGDRFAPVEVSEALAGRICGLGPGGWDCMAVTEDGAVHYWGQKGMALGLRELRTANAVSFNIG